MTYLPLANIAHRKLRTGLSVLGVGIGIAMLITMLSMSHGTLGEVVRRFESVNAELVILPKQENVIYSGGSYFSWKYAPRLREATLDGRPIAKRVIPVYWERVVMAGQQQRLWGIDREDMVAFLQGRQLVAGRLFDEGDRFKHLIAGVAGPSGGYRQDTVPEEEVARACELVIDSLLAKVGGYTVGDTVDAFGYEFRIVGIVEAGVAGRVFAPVQLLRHKFNSGVRTASMYFIQLDDPDRAEDAAVALGAVIPPGRVELKGNYGRLLFESFYQLYVYINVASGIVLLVCFLFILLTMYTMVLERTREIGILKSLGASRWYIMRQSLAESLLICVTGTVIGIGLAIAAKLGIEHYRPLLSIDIEMRWIALAIVVGVLGGVGSALYPGYRAARLDPMTALSFE